MRKNLFEIVNENENIRQELKRISILLGKEKMLHYGFSFDYSIKEFVDRYCFEDWKGKGHCINVNDLYETVGIKDLVTLAVRNNDAFLTIIELAYSLWCLAESKLEEHDESTPPSNSFSWSGNFYHFRDILDDLIANYNCKAYFDEEKECVIVVEDKQEVTAVAEILQEDLAFDVIKYNHRSLKGDIKQKKSILLYLGSELEAKRKNLSSFNSQLGNDIFFMLNNLNIRHNNVDADNGSNYNSYIDGMTDTELEKWYDELYQMMLLAFLTLDNVERAKKVKELKMKIKEESQNGQAQNAHAE